MLRRTTNRTSELSRRRGSCCLWLGGGGALGYRLAGGLLVADQALAPLQPFALTARVAGVPPPPRLAPGAVETPVYAGPGWVGGRMAEVTCARAGRLFVVRVAGVPALLVGRGGCCVSGDAEAPPPSPALVEALLGPGLILALACRDVFALHASAVALDGRAVLLLGDSGAGKSTIARYLATAGGFTPLADDIVPVAAAPRGLDALPHYPQLKQPPERQYGIDRPARVTVAAAFDLCGVDGAPAPAAVEPLAAREAAVLLAAHSVAARLFDAPLLERHLDLCTGSALALPIRRLRFARRLETLPAIAAAIRADLAGLAG